jgi:hypothetical protein
MDGNMRKSFSMTILAALAVTLVACGGGDKAFQNPDDPTDPTTPTVASVTVVTDTPSIPSGGASPATITVFVRDAANQFMEGVPVSFSATSGGLAVVSNTTSANGVATATLTPAGDRTSRTITVTATAGGVTNHVDVAVTGTTVDIQGPDALITATAGSYTVVVTDSSNNPVVSQAVTISSQPTSTLSVTSATTDVNGRANFTMTPTGGAAVTLTAVAAGVTKTKVVTVSADNFAFTSPAADTQFALGAPGATVVVNWLSGGSAVANGQIVNFATTRGVLSSPTAPTAGGLATVSVTSSTAGEAVITATNTSGGSTQRRIVFVASTAAAVDVQANPFTIGINQSSTLTAVVRDLDNNLVSNKIVVFGLNDPTGGSLSVGSAVTDSQGRARTVYTASSTTSANSGVRVTVTVQDTPAVTDFVDLTVAGSPLFISFGTGNTIEEVNFDTQYKLNYVVQVTDSNGAGVPNVPVTLSALSWDYIKGKRVIAGSGWDTQTNAVCQNEDRRTGNPAYDFNGILDPGENENGLDSNGNATLESGNIATITPGSATTDSNGFITVSVFYPQDHAYYVSVALRARTAVQGTEYARTTLPFLLPGASTDFSDITKAPPGVTSPFGVSSSCSDLF